MVVELTVRDVAVLVAKLVVRAVPVADFVIVDAVAGFLTVSLLLRSRERETLAIGKFSAKTAARLGDYLNGLRAVSDAVVAVVLFSIAGFGAVADVRGANFGAAEVTRGAVIKAKAHKMKSPAFSASI